MLILLDSNRSGIKPGALQFEESIIIGMRSNFLLGETAILLDNRFNNIFAGNAGVLLLSGEAAIDWSPQVRGPGRWQYSIEVSSPLILGDRWLLQVGLLFSGAFLVEIVFSWPGIGRYTVQAVERIDYNAIMATTLIVAFIFVVVNLFVDILYLFLDPRISYR